MNRSIAGFLIAIVIVPLALLTLASRVSASSARTTQGALLAPATGLDVVPRATEDTAVFAGGCFWGIEAVFEHIKGVKSAVSGYSGGNVVNPSYEQVSSGDTGHAESVQVVYDPSQVSYARLLQIFFSVALDPTQLNRQGPDVGTQYRSIVFYKDAEQQRVAENYIKQLTDAKTFSRPIVTRVEKLRNFYPAEAYHQDYLAHHPNQLYIVINDKPKVEALKKEFPSYYRE